MLRTAGAGGGGDGCSDGGCGVIVGSVVRWRGVGRGRGGWVGLERPVVSYSLADDVTELRHVTSAIALVVDGLWVGVWQRGWVRMG